MELIQVADAAYQLRGGSNAGLIVQDGQAVLVDTGLDRDTARRILRALEPLKVRIGAVAITHAHADHSGGAATIRARTGAAVYATGMEAAVVANPLFEPLYLFSGAMPPAELRHKFTLAEACPIDGLLQPGDHVIAEVPLRVIPAPGHAPDQVMIAGGGACFVADACLAPEVLQKHGIPFCVQIDQAIATLAELSALDGSYAAFVPGHGPAVTQIAGWAGENVARLSEIREAVAAGLEQSGDLGEVVRFAANRLGVNIPNPVVYWLTQTTILACLASLQTAGRATVTVQGNRLIWQAVSRQET